MEFVDSHCHLDDRAFADDRIEVIDRARAAGLKFMLSIGTGDGPPDLEAAVRLADEYSFVFASCGVHPNDAMKAESATFAHLQALLKHPKVVAVGEIGLDYHWDVPREVQESAFRKQLRMAAEAKMPIIIHTRDAWHDTLRVLREEWQPTGLPCLMHCFTGNEQQAQECLALGFSLAFGGVATFPKSEAIRQAAKSAPLERILIETDAPYLAPAPHRGKRNEPAYLVRTAETLARTLGLSIQELAEATTANFERMFLSRVATAHPLH